MNQLHILRQLQEESIENTESESKWLNVNAIKSFSKQSKGIKEGLEKENGGFVYTLEYGSMTMWLVRWRIFWVQGWRNSLADECFGDETNSPFNSKVDSGLRSHEGVRLLKTINTRQLVRIKIRNEKR